MKKRDKRWIKLILDEFDFDEVKDYYILTGKKWKSEPGIPRVNDLRLYAEDLLTRLCKEKLILISCGCFSAMRLKNNRPVLVWGVDSLISELED